MILQTFPKIIENVSIDPPINPNKPDIIFFHNHQKESRTAISSHQAVFNEWLVRLI